jgi:hypothetical protein
MAFSLCNKVAAYFKVIGSEGLEGIWMLAIAPSIYSRWLGADVETSAGIRAHINVSLKASDCDKICLNR